MLAISPQQHDLAKQGYGDKITKQAIDADQGEATVLDLSFVTNAVKVGGETPETFPFSMAQIMSRLMQQTNGWPRRVNNTLFCDDPLHGLATLGRSAELFGWLRSQRPKVVWHRGPSCATQDELFSELQRTATAYKAIEDLPHFPPIDGHYYSHGPIEPGNGRALDALLAMFCPETTIDADLMRAMFATAFWGGGGGDRPAFVIVSDAGRGVGKSKLVELIGRLVGGLFAISKDDKASEITKRLLTPESLTKRIVLFDNVKTNRLSWAELESLITAPGISGHQMYKGDRTRPNTLLWCLTLNGPTMSKDMAQRVVMVKLAKPVHSGDWEDEAKAYVDRNRWEIIADIAAFFQGSRAKMPGYTRWGTWEKEVLSRLPEPADAQRVIVERRDAINSDDEEAGYVEDHFAQKLHGYGYTPETDTVHIAADLAVAWVNEANHSNQRCAEVIQRSNSGTRKAYLST